MVKKQKDFENNPAWKSRKLWFTLLVFVAFLVLCVLSIGGVDGKLLWEVSKWLGVTFIAGNTAEHAITAVMNGQQAKVEKAKLAQNGGCCNEQRGPANHAENNTIPTTNNNDGANLLDMPSKS